MNIPKGYKLVPVEPTGEMLFACEDAGSITNHLRGARIYRAMLAAAPAPPQPIYDEAKERELFSSTFDLPECVWYSQEKGEYRPAGFTQYAADLADVTQVRWQGWKACAQSRAKAVEG